VARELYLALISERSEHGCWWIRRVQCAAENVAPVAGPGDDVSGYMTTGEASSAGKESNSRKEYTTPERRVVKREGGA